MYDLHGETVHFDTEHNRLLLLDQTELPNKTVVLSLSRLEDMVELLKYCKKIHPEIPTRLNTNGLGDLLHNRSIAGDFAGNILDTISISLNASNAERYLELTRAKYGIASFEAMLKFAESCRKYIKNVVLTVVGTPENQQDIPLCEKLCQERGLKLRVRVYEES